jgi:hypothetical protein
MIIDDRGTTWRLPSWELRQRYFLDDSDPHHLDSLVRLIGCVGVTWTSSRTIVRLEPSVVSQISLAELMYQLYDSKPAHVVLHRRRDGIDLLDRLGPATVAVPQILAEIDAAQPALFDGCQAVSMPLKALDPASGFSELLARTRASNGVYTAEQFAGFLRDRMNGRYAVLEPTECGDFVFRDFGQGYGVPNETFTQSLIGRRLSSLPDGQYASWVQNAYTEAMSRSCPILQRATARVSWPTVGRYQSRYLRLVIPMRAPDGGTVLLGTSHRSDLRRLA